ncbi:MAG: hypothetical protein MJ252_13245, partial [archaeon]|nr:hypothetical protein [archaeon]
FGLKYKKPEFIVVNLQEIVPLDAKNIISQKSNEVNIYFYMATISTILQQEGYILIKNINLVGLFLLVYTKKELKPSVFELEDTTMKFGLFGAFGNKGCCIYEFKFKNKNFAFIDVHLAFGEKNTDDRFNQLKKILSFKNKDQLELKSIDYYFISGDFNFRNQISSESALQYIGYKCLGELQKYDEFLTNSQMDFNMLTESDISFNPTYKYHIGVNAYETEVDENFTGDARTPSWCDRILYKKTGRICCYTYKSIPIYYSDHLPVLGIYNISMN